MKRVFYAEIYKLKRIKALYLVLVLPLLLIGLSVFDFVKNAGEMAPGSNGGRLFLYHFFLNFFTFFSPFFIALFVFSLVQMEFKNGAWENLILLIRNRFQIFLSKMLVAISIGIGYCLVTYICFSVSRAGLTILYPNLNFSQVANVSILMLFAQFVTVYTMMIVIFFNLYLYFENPIAALGVVFFLLVLGLVIVGSRYYIYFPFTYSFKLVRSFGKEGYWTDLTKMSWIWSLVCFLIGYFLFRQVWKPSKGAS